MEKKLEFTNSAKNQIEKITKSKEKKYFRIAVLGGGLFKEAGVLDLNIILALMIK